MAIFYRVLTPKVGDDAGTIDRWRNRQFTSTHGTVPGHWAQRWNFDQSTNPKDYPLNWCGCTYTEAAQQAFLDLAPTHRPDDIWPANERNRASEYEGVSAFKTPQGALDYGHGAPGKLYVVFEGRGLFLLPEDEGCAAKVTQEILSPANREAFIDWIANNPHTEKPAG